MKLKSTNPACNYELIGSVDVSTDAEIATKVARAQAVKTAWKELGVSARVQLLTPIRDEFLARSQEFAELISRETGKALAESKSEMDRYVGSELTWFLENGERALADQITVKDDESLHRIVFEPYGVAAVISPWNFPVGMAVWGIFPNLIAGNPVVFKTSEECPLTGKLMEEVILNHNLPDGVFSEVYGSGDVGQKLAQSNVNILWFTGSTGTGKKLYKIAADKFIKAVLEMGGSNPCIVFDDVDIAASVPIIFNGRYRNNGQFCSALKRLIIHEDIAEELIVKLSKIIESQNVTEPFDPQADHGSLVAKRQLELLQGQYQDALDKGAVVRAQTKLRSGLNGAYFPPTLLSNISKDMRVWHEEVFGPVLPVMTFKTEDEAIKLANDTPFGLGARVMSGSRTRANRIASKIDAGSILLNLETRLIAANPFGGYKLSGLGRERGVHGLQELCQIKAIQDRSDPFYG